MVEKGKKSAPSVRFLSRFWKTLGRNLSRRNRAALAQNALKDAGIRDNIILNLGKYIEKEMTDLCRKKTPSVFRECQPGKKSSVHIYDSVCMQCILTEKLRRFNKCCWGDTSTYTSLAAQSLCRGQEEETTSQVKFQSGQ